MVPFRSLLAAAFLLSFSVLHGLRAAVAPAPKPNIVFIAIDDLKPLLGAYGDKTVRSPNIDRLATRGMTFDRAYCNQAVCAPSRNALMTGLRPTTLGIYDLPTNFRVAAPDVLTLPQFFKQNGYRTEGLGKILHTGHGNHEDAASWSVPHWRPPGGSYALAENRGARTPEGEKSSPSVPRTPVIEVADVADNAYPDGKIADEAIRRLRAASAKPDEPFLLAVGFLKPHLPFCAPKKYWDLYDRAAFELPGRRTPPEGAPRYAPTNSAELRTYSGVPASGALSDAEARELIHGYHAAVSYMDAQLGRVLDELDRLGLADNTIVVLWGDHGWHLGDHGQWCKHTNYEEATRIPLIVAAPRITPAGARSHALIETVDLFPTLAELAGLRARDVPQKLEGRSFAATLREPAAPTKEAILHVYPRNRPGDGPIIGRAVRTERHRLVEWKKPGAAPETADLELYDYVTDPEETKNLAGAQPDVVARLRAILAREPEAKPQIQDPDSDENATAKKKKGAGKKK